MVEGLERASKYIALYAIYESMYLQRDDPIKSQLEGAVTNLYCVILQFLTTAQKFYSHTSGGLVPVSLLSKSSYTKFTLVRTLKNIIANAEKELSPQLDAMAAKHREVQEFLRVIDANGQYITLPILSQKADMH